MVPVRTIPFSLTYAASHLPPPAAEDPLDQLRATEKFWLDWTATSKACGPWTEVVNRSLITLKALTYARTGGIVAAPTTSHCPNASAAHAIGIIAFAGCATRR